jgi:hypothetical protein
VLLLLAQVQVSHVDEQVYFGSTPGCQTTRHVKGAYKKTAAGWGLAKGVMA